MENEFAVIFVLEADELKLNKVDCYTLEEARDTVNQIVKEAKQGLAYLAVVRIINECPV